jgi:hypothetical protein
MAVARSGGVPRGAVSRADLVRAWGRLPNLPETTVASILGLVRSPEVSASPTTVQPLPDVSAAPLTGSGPSPYSPAAMSPMDEPAAVPLPPLDTEIAWAPLPFWRLDRVTWFDEAPTSAEPREALAFETAELKPRGVPLDTPIALPWAQLDAALDPFLADSREGGAVDVARLVEDWARGRPIRQLPRFQVRSAAPRVTLLLDTDPRLDPIEKEREGLVKHLEGRLGRLGVQTYRRVRLARGLLWSREEELQETRLPAAEIGEPVLLVSDLGGSSRTGLESWRVLSETLLAAQLRPIAVLPSVSTSLLDLEGLDWPQVAMFAPQAKASGLWSAVGFEEPEQGKEELLALASVCAVVERGLLRELRGLLPRYRASIATELEVWNDPRFTHGGSDSRFVDLQSKVELQSRFRQLSPEVRAGAVSCLRRWHRGRLPWIWAVEVIQLTADKLVPLGSIFSHVWNGLSSARTGSIRSLARSSLAGSSAWSLPSQ